MALSEIINKYLINNIQYLQDLAMEICRIPSMTGKEERHSLLGISFMK